MHPNLFRPSVGKEDTLSKTALSFSGKLYTYKMRVSATLLLVGVCSQVFLSGANIYLRTFTNPEASEAIELKSGVDQTVPTTAKGAYVLYKITVPAGSVTLSVRTYGGSGDLDLFVRFNSPPAQNQYDDKSVSLTTYEKVVIHDPKEGVYYFLLDVDTPIKGVKIVSEVGRVGKRAQYGELLRDLLNMLQK